jgi:quercetin dioxygenase-like cupin family protein
MEIRRFGVGHRRPDGPVGTEGVAGQAIHSDARGVVSELAFARRGRVEPHSNPNTTWFVVIEGGGFAGVGDEVARVAAGDAVLWPAGVVHSAWTDLSEMRAIVVEFAGPDDGWARGVIDGRRALLGAGDGAEGAAALAGSPGSAGRASPGGRVTPGEGRVVRLEPPDPDAIDRSSGEPV